MGHDIISGPRRMNWTSPPDPGNAPYYILHIPQVHSTHKPILNPFNAEITFV